MTKRMERLLDALTGPAMAFEGIERWREVPLAHQGLVGPDAPGNSLEAFDKAARSGYGIELDVRLCKDGLVVLHDRTVDCAGGVRRVRDMTRAELLAALPKGCAPELGPALMLIAGRVPLAVELKSDGLRGAGKLARAAAQALDNYAGPRCVLSFDPRALRAFGKLLPDVPRGQLVAGRADMRRWCGRALGWLLGNLLLNCVSRPALAAVQADAHSRGIAAWRRRGRACAAWTLTTRAQVRRARAQGDIAIFEGEEARVAVEREYAGRWDVLRRWTGLRG